MNWIEGHAVTIRSVVIYAATVLSVVGLFASCTDHYRIATMAWVLAFLCKWIECLLLDRALTVNGQKYMLTNVEKENR